MRKIRSLEKNHIWEISARSKRCVVLKLEILSKMNDLNSSLTLSWWHYLTNLNEKFQYLETKHLTKFLSTVPDKKIFLHSFKKDEISLSSMRYYAWNGMCVTFKHIIEYTFILKSVCVCVCVSVSKSKIVSIFFTVLLDVDEVII